MIYGSPKHLSCPLACWWWPENRRVPGNPTTPRSWDGMILTLETNSEFTNENWMAKEGPKSFPVGAWNGLFSGAMFVSLGRVILLNDSTKVVDEKKRKSLLLKPKLLEKCFTERQNKKASEGEAWDRFLRHFLGWWMWKIPSERAAKWWNDAPLRDLQE